MTKDSEKRQERSFSEALNALQQAADEISKQTTGLEDSMKLFERGMQDAAYCSRILEEAEQKIAVYHDAEEGEGADA